MKGLSGRPDSADSADDIGLSSLTEEERESEHQAFKLLTSGNVLEIYILLCPMRYFQACQAPKRSSSGVCRCQRAVGKQRVAGEGPGSLQFTAHSHRNVSDVLQQRVLSEAFFKHHYFENDRTRTRQCRRPQFLCSFEALVACRGQTRQPEGN